MTTGTIEKSGRNGSPATPGERNLAGSLGGSSAGPGGGGPFGEEFFEEAAYPSNKYRILMWFLLLAVLMTFGGLIGAYIVVSTNGVLEWKPFNLPVQVWVSTVLIFASSVTYHLAHRSLFDGRQEKARRFYLATAVLGGMFIASQLLVWLAIVQRGVYLQSNPYAGFFYILTAVHAIHVIGGIVALGYIVLRSWLPTKDPEELEQRRVFSGPIGWYWHFMDVMWIVLLALLGFWK
jgi:cytochrome c oxidase subunit 3